MSGSAVPHSSCGPEECRRGKGGVEYDELCEVDEYGRANQQQAPYESNEAAGCKVLRVFRLLAIEYICLEADGRVKATEAVEYRGRV
jgi:hypothetical protein